MSEKLPPYILGLADGIDIALRIHKRRFDKVSAENPTVARALKAYDADVQSVIHKLQTRRLGEVSVFFGFDNVWSDEQAPIIRDLAPLDVELGEES